MTPPTKSTPVAPEPPAGAPPGRAGGSASGARPNGRILYSSFQTGQTLPGFIRYALSGLVRTGFPVVLLTNRRELDAESTAFLEQQGIELFFTVNHGFDFGMWRRYLESVPADTRNAWERLLLVNDSVVYFRDVFPGYLREAESRPADMVSLTSNDMIAFHLQSFFLYLKPRAIRLFYVHLLESSVHADYKEIVKSMEVGFSQRLIREDLVLDSLFHTDKPISFASRELICRQAGFVKRRLLEWRFGFPEMLFFNHYGESRALVTDYARLIERRGGRDPNFRPEWLRTRPGSPLLRKMGGTLYWLCGRTYFLTVYPIRCQLNHYWKWSSRTLLLSDLLVLLIGCGAGICAGIFGGGKAAGAGFIAAVTAALIARWARRRWRRP